MKSRRSVERDVGQDPNAVEQWGDRGKRIPLDRCPIRASLVDRKRLDGLCTLGASHSHRLVFLGDASEISIPLFTEQLGHDADRT